MRVGLIGTEGHTGFVLDGILDVEGAELAACARGHADDTLDRVRRHAAFTGSTRVFDDYGDMLDTVDLDIVGVCRPYHLNAAASMAVARAGRHIVSEKPVATTLADLDALEEAVELAGVRLTAMLGMRLEPPFAAARKAVADGLIGEPILATAQKSYRFGTRPDFYRDRQTYGGSIPWVAIHAVDYTRWAAGLEYTQVAALHGNLAHPAYPGCEDQGGILFRFANGGTAMVNMDYLRPAAAPSHGDDRLRIAGSEGVVEVVDLATRTELIRADEGPRDLPLPAGPSFLADLVGELQGGKQHVVGPDEAVRVTRVCLKAREAADTGRVVDLTA